MVVDDVERGVDDRCGEARAVGVADVAIVEMQSARAKDLGREIELLPPVGDDRLAEEARRPLVHLRRDLLGHRHEPRIAMDRQLQVALVVERHRRHLAERVLAVEHPAVGAAQQRVGDVAKPDLDRRAGPRRRAGALDPLPLADRAGSRAPTKLPSRASLTLIDVRPITAVRIEKADALTLARALGTPRDARGHDLLARGIEARQRLHHPHGIVGDDVRIIGPDGLAKLKRHRSLIPDRLI